jgi:hypothetical protein
VTVAQHWIEWSGTWNIMSLEIEYVIIKVSLLCDRIFEYCFDLGLESKRYSDGVSFHTRHNLTPFQRQALLLSH